MDDIEQRLRNRSVTRWIPSPDETPETKYYDVDAERAEAADTILALRAQVLALQWDAERYRWLRDDAPEKWATWADERDQDNCDAAEIDSAIDSARMPAGAGT